MIIVDYSGCAIAGIMMFQEDLYRGNDNLENLVRHVILSSLKSYKKRFSAEFGKELILACDGGNNWRKAVFPHYKYKRKKDKEASDIPWDEIYRHMNLVQNEIREFFPYKVIQHDRAEADDVMAVLARDVAVMNTSTNGLYEEPEPTLIISSDKDMKQLLSLEHVKHFLPRDNKFVKLEETPKMFLRRLILTGDVGDGVPNVFSPNDSFFTGTRQKPATEKKMLPFLEAKNMMDASTDPVILERLKENSRLISFSFIPKDIRDEIIESYAVPAGGSKMTIFNYLASKDMKQMMKDIDEF